jgi:hypothetical protein
MEELHMTEAFPRFQISLGANYVVRADTYQQLCDQLNFLFEGDQSRTTEVLRNWGAGLRQQSEKVAQTQASAPTPASGSQSSNDQESDPGPAPSCRHGEMGIFKPRSGRRKDKRSWACQGKDAAGNWLDWSEKCKAIDIDK